SVRRPASVADSIRSSGRFLRNKFGERCNSTGALAHLDVIAIDDGDTGRIVAAIFEAAKTVEQNGRRLRTSDIADNSAHIGSKGCHCQKARATGAKLSKKVAATREH